MEPLALSFQPHKLPERIALTRCCYILTVMLLKKSNLPIQLLQRQFRRRERFTCHP